MLNYLSEFDDRIVDEAVLLDIYKKSIPSEFDTGFIELHKEIRLEWDKAMNRSGLRYRFAQNAMQGNYSRCMFEDSVMSLAEEHGLKTGIFESAGGSSHVKISTDNAVLTFHTLGDKDDNFSRFAEYKKVRARNNPFKGQCLNGSNKKDTLQGTFFIDDDIGSPEVLPPGFVSDQRIYFTICVPRIFHSRDEIFLIVPNSSYLGTILEFNYLEIRDSSLTKTEVKLYDDNVIQKKPIFLKNVDENIILPKQIDLGEEEQKEN